MQVIVEAMALSSICLLAWIAYLYFQYWVLESRHDRLLEQVGNVEELETNLRKDLKAVKEFHAHYHQLRRAYYNLTGKKIVPGYWVEDEDGKLSPE